MTRRDVHRQRVYDAEEAAFGGTLLDDPLDWDTLVALFGAVVHHPWWRSLGVTTPALVQARVDSQRSSSDGTTIRISPHGRTPLTVAHELAHHISPGDQHGPAFRAAELRTVAVVGGVEARRRLAAEWARWGLPPGSWDRPEPPDGPGIAVRGVIAL